jgi:hypothetical protein
MRKTLWSILIICVLAAMGCSDKAAENKPSEKPPVMPPAFVPAFAGTTPQDMAKNLIVRYNQLLIFGYENLNMNFLQEVATHDQAEKAYFHMAAIGEGGVRMRSRLNNIEWERIDQSKKDVITVKTKELWDFAYHDIKTDQLTEEHKAFVYHMTYTITPDKNGRWLISNIRAVADESAAQAKKNEGKAEKKGKRGK